MKSTYRDFFKVLLFIIPTLVVVLLLWQYGDSIFTKFTNLFKVSINKKNDSLYLLSDVSISINGGGNNHHENNNNNNNNNLTNIFSKNFLFYFSNNSNKSISEYARTRKPILAKYNLLTLPEQNDCGRPEMYSSLTFKMPYLKRLSRIVRGNEASPSSFPWMASLKHFRNNVVQEHFCAGSLVYEIYVLTAAHCVYGLKSENFVVVLGLHILNDTSKFAQSNTFRVSKVVLHEGYNHKDPYYDVAILKLNNKVTKSRYISPICLPESTQLSDSIMNEYAIVTGWGRSEPDAAYVPNQIRKLQQTVLKIINGDQLCSKHLHTFDYTNLYCAYDTNTVKNSNVCIGDSGGPLMIYRDGRYYLYGIVSFVFTFLDTDGKYKCYTQAPSYYTKVPQYVDWLVKNLI